jgi:hypothetical protein
VCVCVSKNETKSDNYTHTHTLRTDAGDNDDNKLSRTTLLCDILRVHLLFYCVHPIHHCRSVQIRFLCVIILLLHTSCPHVIIKIAIGRCIHNNNDMIFAPRSLRVCPISRKHDRNDDNIYIIYKHVRFMLYITHIPIRQ